MSKGAALTEEVQVRLVDEQGNPWYKHASDAHGEGAPKKVPASPRAELVCTGPAVSGGPGQRTSGPTPLCAVGTGGGLPVSG